MDISLHANASPARIKTPVLAVAVHADGTLSEAAARVDQAASGAIRELLAQEPGAARDGQLTVLRRLPGVAAGRVAVIGMGESAACSPAAYESACRLFARHCAETGADGAVSALASAEVDGMAARDRARLAASIAAQATYAYAAQAPYAMARAGSSRASRPHGLWMSKDQAAQARTGAREGAALGAGINFARLLADLPANYCTPAYLGETARRLARDYPGMKAQVLTRAQIEKLGMGSFLAVARGSDEPPAFIVLRHAPRSGAVGRAPVVLVGKGVTFDSGGLSIKTAAGMEEMKYDMGGAACVLGVMRAVAELGLPHEVIALVPACENMPGGRALKPGDVVTSMSGQTIEVLNTDAEGRLILCDALTYAARFEPAAVIDVATLTGACVTALGFVHSGLFANDDALAEQLLQAGRQARDTAWRMPLDDAYQEQLHSPFADMSNVGGPPAGSVTAACFLSRFAKAYPWAHLDVAGTARRRGKDRQATGRPVSLLVQYLIDRC